MSNLNPIFAIGLVLTCVFVGALSKERVALLEPSYNRRSELPALYLLAVANFTEAYLNEKLNKINMGTQVSSTANVQPKSFKDDQLMMEEIFKKLNYQPSGLTDYEQENPLDMITEFFTNHALHDLREKAWQLYKGWVNSSSDFADGAENVEMLFFYTQLIDFMNASYVYTKTKSNNPEKFKG